MRLTKNSLLRGVARFNRYAMIEGEGATEDNSSGGGAGNSPQTGNESTTGDNAGKGFDAASFWNEPVADTGKSPETGSTDSNKPATGTEQADEGKRFATDFATKLAAAPLGGPIFTAKQLTKAAEGDYAGINAALEAQGRESIKHSVMFSAQLLQQYGANLEARFEAKMNAAIEAKFGNRDNTDTLLQAFPSAKDPAIRPMIEGVFNQALKHTKGDRTKAVEMAQGMLKFMGKGAASDMGIETPPSSSGDTMTPNAKSLVEELLAKT